MAIVRLDSRYAKAEIKTDENGVQYLDWFADIKFDASSYDDNEEYKVLGNDTVFTVASRFYGSQRYFWVVCRANLILNPFKKLKPGSRLTLPSDKTFRTKILGEE